jgi:15-cis-phytoene desaturase
MDQADVVIVGSGLAGMAAAHRLAVQGFRALVLEAGAVLGGRTSSWTDNGMPIDSGLHKFLGIYRALPSLLREVGVDAQSIVSWEDAVQIHVPDEEVHAYYRAAPLHKPLRTLLTALGNNALIPPMAKLAFSYMTACGLRECAAHPLKLDRSDIFDYARRSGVSEAVCRRLLAAVTQGVLFMPPERFSAYAVFAPVLEGLKNGLTFRVGAFRGGMTDVMMRPIATAIEQRGGRILIGVRVTRLAVDSDRVIGVETESETILARHVVLAVPLRPAQELIRTSYSSHPWFAPMLSLGDLSAVTLQMDLDGPALPADHTNFSNGPLCCFAEQSRTTFTHVPGRFSVILYPPEEFLTMEPAAILTRAIAEAKRIGMNLEGRVKDFRVVRHPHDFYALSPGSEALRPEQATPVPGLTLAGDYTRQPWVASMEGAVVSGERAAAAVLQNARCVGGASR